MDESGWHVELDQRYVRSVLDAMAMDHYKSMTTLGSKEPENNGSIVKLLNQGTLSSDLVLESVST